MRFTKNWLTSPGLGQVGVLLLADTGELALPGHLDGNK